MHTYSQALRCIALLTSLLHFLPQLAHAQEFDAENEKFPGAKQVKVEAFGLGPEGFWAEYKFDGQGRATDGRVYFRRQLNIIEQYSFTSRNKLQQERVINPGMNDRIQIFSFSYQYSPDSARIIRKTVLSGTDTMYVFHYLEFDRDNRPTKFTKAKGWSRKPNEVTELTYTNGRLTNSRLTEQGEKGAVIYTESYQYNIQGDLVKHHRSMSPPSPVSWFDGQGDTLEYSYDYSPKGPWTRQYQFFKSKKVLIAKRTITY
ncbi:hypothetical protein [Hymenobacter sp.]|jgi:hypothetical protein|uniref:hypothetical protein n=1 Tax=Hymenobacter sp. TaxID=1898978 RepID=UPI002ED83A94